MAPAFPIRSHAIMTNLLSDGILPAEIESLRGWSERLTEENLADYASTISALAIALDGNKTGLSPLGYLFAPTDMDVIIPFNIFPHPENTNIIALHLYRPCGSEIIEGIKMLVAMVRDADTADPDDARLDFTLRRFAPSQLKIIHRELKYADSEPWFGSAPYEDDSFANVIIDAQALVDEIGTSRFKTVRLARQRFINQLNSGPQAKSIEWEDYDPEKHSDIAKTIIEDFFQFDGEKKRRISVPEHYYNLLGENLRSSENFIRQVALIGGEPAAWLVLERVDNSDVWALPVNMALHHKFRGLSEETVFHAATLIHELGDRWIDMGGSENRALCDFKSKFLGKPPVTVPTKLQSLPQAWQKLES